MKRLLIVVSLVTAMACVASTAGFSGTFEGTGRACSGELTIKQRKLAWSTSFSKCPATGFEIIDRSESTAKTRVTYQLKHRPPQCLFEVISLTHENNSGSDKGWEATGYGTAESFMADQKSGYQASSPDMTSCYLVRKK